ncbi:hypothetical protein LCGC14_0319220 [marine sediment metagenome]|uniref:N-acetyltransferase domain-containing protein n=1 Tax=marine sediment metagenome TaxID=412755 RepID=A0A0F9TQ58_9ZZZZ|nr:N-acetyltransferase [Maribacter sp.]HDZ06577.1 GNAT family N-acetyltransferase [Maribacter sp.]HEA81191.1 GNAT family N-acetyltransferase [Maribacter sp.]
MKLKKAALKDIVDLKNICIDAYALNFHHHWNEGGLEWYLEKEFSIDRLTSDILDSDTDYYFIEHELKSIGFLKIKNNLKTDSEFGNSSELEKIYVLPSSKGLGIGKLTLNEIINRTKEKGGENLFLSVIDTNLDAIAFYKKLGFVFSSKTTLDIPYFKEELKGMNRMVKKLM